MSQRAKLICLSFTVALVSRIVIAGDHATSDITTREGKTYKDVTVQRAEPDGILCSYRAEGGGIGMAKLKFAVLPENLKQKYGYDVQRATAFESSQAQAQVVMRAKLWADYQDATDRIAKRVAHEEAENRAKQIAEALALANQRAEEARLMAQQRRTSPASYQGLPSQSQSPTAQAQQQQQGQQNLPAAAFRRR